MERKSVFPAVIESPLFVPVVFALLKLLMHLLANAFAPFEFFRDELYYIVSTDHLEAGYVDHPPLSIWILALSRIVFGDSLFAIRLLPALAGSVTVFLVGLMVWELGGGRGAQALACAATVISAACIALHTIYSMNAWDWLVWSTAILLLLKIGRQPSLQLWMNLGVVLGLGLLNKVSILWLGAGLGAGILLTPLRSELRTKGPWIAAGLAFFLFLPYIAWNAANDWAHLEFMRNASTFKYSGINPLDTLLGQLLINNPATVPLWIAGLVFFFLPSNRNYRLIGIVYVAALVILLVNGTSKPEYLSPAVPVLFAGGAVLIDRLRVGWLRLASRAVLAVLFAGGLVLLPIVLPILPAEQFIAFAKAIGFQSKNMESKAESDLPQFYADMHGWHDLASAVNKVHRSLTDDERARCVILAQNYGQASAITFLGRPLGLPAAISGHNSYYLWGPGPITDSTVVLVLGGDKEGHERVFDDVQLANVFSSPHIMPYEDHKPIFICRRPKASLEDAWQRVKNYS